VTRLLSVFPIYLSPDKKAAMICMAAKDLRKYKLTDADKIGKIINLHLSTCISYHVYGTVIRIGSVKGCIIPALPS
jgi:hypothetical protein